METLQWLDYFTDGIIDVHVNVGKEIYTRRMNPDYVREGIVTFVAPEATIYESVSEEITTGKFFYEISKILTTKTQWEQFFSHQGITLSLPNAKNEDQFRLHAENGTKGKAHMIIRKVPSAMPSLNG